MSRAAAAGGTATVTGSTSGAFGAFARAGSSDAIDSAGVSPAIMDGEEDRR